MKNEHENGIFEMKILNFQKYFSYFEILDNGRVFRSPQSFCIVTHHSSDIKDIHINVCACDRAGNIGFLL